MSQFEKIEKGDGEGSAEKIAEKSPDQKYGKKLMAKVPQASVSAQAMKRRLHKKSMGY